MKKRILLLILMLLLMIPAGLLALMSSASGSRWLVQTAFSYLPAQVSAGGIEGRLLERMVLSGLYYRDDTQTASIKNLVLAWQPSELFAGVLKIVEITADEVDVNITKPAPPAQEPFDFNAELRLPVRIVLENLLLTDLVFQQQGKRQRLQKLHLTASTEQGLVKIAALDVEAEPLAATVAGQIGLGKGFPLALTADWQAQTADYGLWQATTSVSGDIEHLSFGNQLSSPFKSSLQGQLENLPGNPRIAAHGDWQNLNWPLGGGKPQFSSEHGTVEVTGLFSDYQIRLNGRLTQPYLSNADLSFAGQGSTEALSIQTLELRAEEGAFQINGDISWKDATVFDLTANGQNFNPVILSPELPGSLTFNTHLNGRLVGNALQLDAEIKQLSGQLRNYPLSAGGKLALADEQLKVDAFELVSGTNKIAVNGTLGQQQSALTVAIEAPALKELWPNLGGSLIADGRLQGAWRNPSVKFQAGGRQLHYGGYNAEQLALNIDYQAEKTSQIALSARAIKTGKLQIDKLQVDGAGTLRQHRFKAEIDSSYGQLASAMIGRYQAEVWQGEFYQLDLNTKDSGRWRLVNSFLIRLAQSAAGIDTRLSKACLARQGANFCLQGQRSANGDFQFKANAAALPTGLIDPFLPGSMQLKGLINADADMQRQKGLLNGNFRLTMPENAKILLQTEQGPMELALGRWLVSGTLKRTIVSADFDLGLTGRDYLRGQLQLDTGSAKTLDGRLTAAVRNFSVLNPFVPQLSNIRGELTADLALRGRSDKPIVSGAARLNGGAADLADLGLRLREITFQALAAPDAAERIALSASAKSGQGFIQAEGFAALTGAVELKVLGTDFEVAKLPEAQVAVSPELKAVLSEQQRKVSGKVKIPKAVLQLTQLPENAVNVSADEIILGEQEDRQVPVEVMPLDADIDIELGKQVSFSGWGLNSALSGHLKMNRTGQATTLFGTVNMDKASYKSYGQDLSVRKGHILFNGPVDKPWLDVEAIRVAKNKDVTVILTLTGPVTAPKTQLSSEPALPEEEVLAYLITGGPLNEVSQAEGNAVAAAALSYGAGKASWIAKKLGVGEVELEQGKTLQDTMAAVGQYLTPNFYVGTKVGLFNQQVVLVLKRKLTKSLNVETQTGTSQRIKLNFERDSD